MTYVLIDNATLTAAQRVLGEIEVKNTDTINGDIAAYENFIQAILFYDELICIDNYKDEFKEERKSYFDFVRFLDPKDYQLSDLEDKAKVESSLIKPEIRGGEFADSDFGELLEQLKMNMVCTWDLRSSVYYLTMKMLGQPNTPEFEKYSELSSTIFNELSDAGSTFGRWSTNVELVGSDGTIHTEADMKQAAKEQSRGYGGTTRGLDMFIASLNWLAYKSIYYSLSAKYLKADTLLHPIRHAYQLHWMKKSGVYGQDFTSKLLNSLSSNITTTVSKCLDHGRCSALSLEVPIFSAWIATQSGNMNDSINSALELRKHNDFVELRSLLKEIRVAYDESGYSEANKIITKWDKELQKASQNLLKVYGVDSGQGIQSGNIIKAINSISGCFGGPAFPDIEFKIPLPDFIQSNTSASFSNIYKNVGA